MLSNRHSTQDVGCKHYYCKSSVTLLDDESTALLCHVALFLLNTSNIAWVSLLWACFFAAIAVVVLLTFAISIAVVFACLNAFILDTLLT